MASIPSNGYAEVMSGTNNYSGSNSYDGSCPRTAIAPVIGNDLCNKTYVDSVSSGGLTDKGSLLTGNGTTEVIFDQNPYQTPLVTTTVFDWNSLTVGMSKTFKTTFPTLIPLGARITITYSGTDNIKGNVTAVTATDITLTITAFSSAVYTNTTLWIAPGNSPATPDSEALPDVQPFLGIPAFPTTTSSIVITSGQTFLASNPVQTLNVKIKSTVSATTLGTSLPFNTNVAPAPPALTGVGFAFTAGVFVAQNDIVVGEFDSTTPPSFIDGVFWTNALNSNYYTGTLAGYTLTYSTGSIVIDDDICLIADDVSSTGLAWSLINAAAVGVTNTNTNATYYPTFVAGSGTQALLADISTGPFSINPNNGNINLADTIKINQTQVSLGKTSGGGANTGTVAIGQGAGLNQNVDAIAIGRGAAGSTLFPQRAGSVAIGTAAGQLNQPVNSVAIGESAGQNGDPAGFGFNVAIGASAGRGLVAVQGAASVAIGAFAGQNSNTTRSIIINATGAALDNPATPDALFIKPIRGVAWGIGANRMVYTAATGEVTYSTT